MSARQTTYRAAIVFYLAVCCVTLSTSAFASSPKIGRPVIISPRIPSASLTTLQSNDTRVGTNVPALAPGMAAPVMFVDAMRQALPWVSNAALKTDEDGNVTALLPGQIAQSTISGNYPAGIYTLLYEGTGTLAVAGAVSIRAGPGRMIVRVPVVPVGGLRVLLSGVDPNDYVRNIRLIMPGFESSYINHPFHPAFIQAMQRFHVLRFKNWEHTDSYAVSATWTERPQVWQFSQAGPAGVAPEYQIALANVTGDDPWFSIPMGATDYYIANLAQLVHSTLDPRLHPIFEYGYEVWQPGSPDNLYAQMAGSNFRLSGNRQVAALDWYSLRSVQAFGIINRVFGADMARVTRVISGPLGPIGSWATSTDSAILTYANAGQYADAFAVAAYDTALNSFVVNVRTASELARFRHLALLAYDGPQQPLLTQFLARYPAPNAALSRILFSASLEAWHAAGGSLFVAGTLNPYDVQKLSGITDYLQRHPYAHTVPASNVAFVPPTEPQEVPRGHRRVLSPNLPGAVRPRIGPKVLPLPIPRRRPAVVTGTTYTPGTTAATQTPFYKFPGESGAISQQMDPSAIGSLTNETLTYTANDGNNWGWVSGPNEPNMTSWPATNYVVTLNITQPNANLQLNEVRIFRVNSSGGPGYNGLAVVADMPGLTQSLGTAGALTFTLAGSAQTANSTDRLVVKFNVTNLASSTQSFSYDAGAGAVSGLTVGSSGSPPPGSLTVSPTSLTFTNLTTTSPFTASESNYTGVINQNSTTSCAGIASVTPTSGNGPSTQFTVTPQAQGSCTITVTDDHGGSTPVNVTVSLSSPTPSPSPSPSPSGSPPPGTIATVIRWDSSFYYVQNSTCGHFHVAYNGNTVFIPSKAAIVAGSNVDILGSGDCHHNNIVATQISLVGSPSPSPSPSSSPSASPSPSPSVSGIPDITTFHIDNARTGWNPLETKLTTANVKSSFGRISQLAVDGNVVAQPLFVAQYQVSGQGTHNLVIIATEHNSVYAFDADTLAQVWHVNLGTAQNSADVNCADINPEYGISSTPVINRTGPGAGSIYVVAATEPTSMSFHTKLHKLDIGTGMDQLTPVEITASALLTNGSMIHLNAQNQYNRTSLFMVSGSVYVGFGAHCDNHPVTLVGWLLRYDQALQQTSSFNTIDEASNSLASIWMSGYPSAVDASGNIFFATGNGAFDINTGGKNYGETVVKIKPDLSQVLSYFTPANWSFLNTGDYDLGAGGVMLIPGSNDLVAKGKNPTIWLLSQTNLGGEKSNNSGALQAVNDLADTHGGPAYFKSSSGTQYIYYQADSHPLRSYTFNGSRLTLSATAPGLTGPGGSSPVVSSNGSQAGTGIVWVAQHGDNVTLQAYDATNVQTLLFTGAAGVWSTGQQNDFISPLVVNGRVFVGATNTVTVFGLH